MSSLLDSNFAAHHEEKPVDILIVEDSAIESEMLRRLIVGCGFTARETRNGQEALEAIAEQQPALVMSDINMPIMNGYDLCRAIKTNPETADLPVILLTALSDPNDIIAAIDAGADSYATKPYDRNLLIRRARSLISHPQRHSEVPPLEIDYAGQRYEIGADRRQILNLLLSVYENIILQNEELTRAKEQLGILNKSLEDRVIERTEFLTQTQAKLQRVNRTLQAIRLSHQAIVHATNTEEMYLSFCQRLTDIGGFALVALIDLSCSPAQPLAAAGTATHLLLDTLNGSQQSVAEWTRNIRDSSLILSNSCLPEHADCAAWLTQHQNDGLLVVPLANEKIQASLILLSHNIEELDAESQGLYEELAGDLLFGVSALGARQQRDEALGSEAATAQRLKASFENAIFGIASMLEKRDPYTAGHQQNVARIATAIARRLGLPQKQIEGINFGALVHDIGKIAVPAEILTRPGRLHDFEWPLIRQHSLAGYEILKDIDFPWPVAEMVYQHHERLDGSGYPRALKGEEIIMEARILAVADQVDAMVSHRPYRAAVGLEPAVEALLRERGVALDATVVDACVGILREDGLRAATG